MDVFYFETQHIFKNQNLYYVYLTIMLSLGVCSFGNMSFRNVDRLLEKNSISFKST